MRTVRRNKQRMKYALYLGNLDIVQTDFDGNPEFYVNKEDQTIYMVTGEKKEVYSEPQNFDANFSTSGGEAQDQEYGLDISQYDGIAIFSKAAYPIVEGSIIWTKSHVEYDEEDSGYYTKDMKTLIESKSVKKESADYVCKKVDDSLNYTKAIFTAINK